MVNFSPLAAEIRWRVWGTPPHFNGFCVLAALLHGTVVVGVSQTFLSRFAGGISTFPLFLSYSLYVIYMSGAIDIICRSKRHIGLLRKYTSSRQ